MADLFHECGIAAIYHFGDTQASLGAEPRERVSRLLPYMLLDIQNRGQLAAGITSYHPDTNELLRTRKDVGTVTEVFRMNHKEDFQELMADHTSIAAIGHVRYATCGQDDVRYAQPFERTHLEKKKWFAFGFNGQLANYIELRNEIRQQGDFHLARETDTETLMHLISQEIKLQDGAQTDYVKLLGNVARRLDGAYNIVLLDSLGNMVVTRDPLGFRPLCYAERDGLFAAASESVALSTIGFSRDDIKDLDPGCAIIIQNGKLTVARYAESPRKAHCFFEWIYFANVCSRLDDRSVYLARKTLGEELAAMEKANPALDSLKNAIVVPVPDTAKAAAEGMAFDMQIPCLEGLMRHRALGRTFIEGEGREEKARRKYIPLPEVLTGKKVFLVDDTIVRSTTMRVLIQQLRERGGADEVHVRIACPPIVAPCFYGIDMSNMDDLFAPEYLDPGQMMSPEIEVQMAKALGADSLRYLPIDAIARAVKRPSADLCQACLTAEYPTPAGEVFYGECLHDFTNGVVKSGNGKQRKIECDPPRIATRL